MTRIFPRLLFCWCAFVLALRAASPALSDGLFAEIETPRGVVVCELYFDRAPLTVASFVGLAEGRLGPAPRKPFFDGLTFHRVVPGFVVQGGDPTGTGDGGPGYAFADEFGPGLRHDAVGVLSMANDGPDTNGSQFFLTLRETNRLNFLHSVFGRVVRGLEVLPAIQPGDTMTVKIRRIGARAQQFQADEAAFAALSERVERYRGSALPGEAAHFDDPDGLLPAEPPRAKNFNFKLANVERARAVRIVARVFAQSPPHSEGRKIGQRMRELATKLGVEQRGALAVYFADRHEWKLWLGDESAAAFMRRPGTVKEFMQDGAFHAEKQAFLDRAVATGNADFEAQVRAAKPENPPPAKQRLKLQADAVIDGLIERLDPSHR